MSEEKNQLSLDIKGNELSQKKEWFTKRDEMITEAIEIKTIENAEDFEVVSKLQGKMKKHIKTLKNLRLDITRKIDALKKQFTDQEKDFVFQLQIELNGVQKKCDSYATKIRKEEQEEKIRLENLERERVQKEIQEAEEKAQSFRDMFGLDETAEIAVEPPPIVAPIKTFSIPVLRASSNAKMVDVWDFEIVEPSKVPRAYLVVDESKVREFMRHQIKIENQPKLDGVVFTKSTKVQSK